MLTEVGVARVVPWAAARSVAVWKGARAEKGLAKWRATAREAAKQSRRSWHPVVDPLATTAQVAELVATAERVTGRVIATAPGAHPNREWDSADWVCDPGAARRLLGWTPTVDLAEGLGRTWAAA